MRKADNLPPYRAVVMKSVSLNFLHRPVMGELYLLRIHTDSIRNNTLHDLTLIKMTVAQEIFLINEIF